MPTHDLKTARPFTLINHSANKLSDVMRPETRNTLYEIAQIPSSHPTTNKDDILKYAANAQILISGWGSTPLTAEELSSFTKLELIIHAAGSLRSLYPDLKFPPNVSVCSAVHINARPVAEYTLGLILSSLRGAFQWTQQLKAEGLSKWWDLHHNQANGYADRTIAIVGFGEIAKRLLSLLKPFEFNVLVVSEWVTPEDELEYGIRRVSIEEAASRADVLSLHEADLPCFKNMINQEVLDTLKNGSILINTARAGLIDEAALVQTLKKRTILALLDVIENENTAEDDDPLLNLPNCFITPHVAGAVQGEIKRFGDFVLTQIQNHIEGKPLEGVIPLETIAVRA